MLGLLTITLLVGDDDSLNQRVAHDVDLGKGAKGDAFDGAEEIARFGQAASFPRGQVDLCDVARHDGA